MKYCVKCGSILADEDSICSNCGASAKAGTDTDRGPDPAGGRGYRESPGQGEEYPPKYLPWAIVLIALSVILCCPTILTGVPGGIVALVYGGKIDNLMATGRKEEAWRASRTAKLWLIASTAVSAVFGAFMIAGMIFAAATGQLKP